MGNLGEELKNVAKEKAKEMLKKVLKKLVPYIAGFIGIILAGVLLVAIFSAVVNVMADLISGIQDTVEDMWKYVADDYWTDMTKGIAVKVVDENGNVTQTAEKSIVLHYMERLNALGISMEDLRLLGEADYTDEKKLLEDEENLKLAQKYIGEFLRADLISQNIHKRRNEKPLVKKENENLIDGGVYLYRTKNEFLMTKINEEYQEKNEYEVLSKDNENIYKMEYKENDEFFSLKNYNTATNYDVNSIPLREIMGSYTIAQTDDSKEQYKAGDLLYYKIDYKTTVLVDGANYNTSEDTSEINIVIQSIDYKSLISKYAMPFEFLINLCMITQNPEFVYHVAYMARDTTIEILIMDSVVQTKTEEITTADGQTKYQVYRPTVQGGWVDYQKPRSLGNNKIEEKTTIEMVDVPELKILKVNTWSHGLLYEYTHHIVTKPEENITTTLDDKTSYDLVEKDEITGDSYRVITEWTNCKKTTKVTTIRNEYNKEVLVGDSNQALRKSKHFLGLLRNDTGECPSENIEECVKDSVFNKNGINVKYRIPNSTKEEMPYSKLKSGEQILYSLLQTQLSESEEGNSAYNEKMQGLAEYVQWLLTFPENEEFNLADDEMDNMLNGNVEIQVETLIIKTDEADSVPKVTEEELIQIIENKYTGTKKENAYQILDTLIQCQDTYNLSAVFILAVAQQETSVGTADTKWVREHNNWVSWDLGTKYSSASNNISTMANGIAQGSYYFTQGKVTVKDIGYTYCPNTNDYPNQGDNWVSNVTATMISMYNSIGMDVSVPTAGETDIGELDDGNDYVGTHTANGKTYINYKQAGPSWKSQYFCGGTVKKYGCSITSVSIILSGYGYNVTPKDLAIQYPESTSLQGVLSTYGISSTSSSEGITSQQVINHMKQGKIMIIHVGNGYWTSGTTHYFVILDYKEENGKHYVYVSNPGTKNGSKNGWINVDKVIEDTTSKCLFID